jgi:hypothetical protein
VSATYLHRFEVSGSGALILLSHSFVGRNCSPEDECESISSYDVDEVIRSREDGREWIWEEENFSVRRYQQLRSMGR